MFVRAKSMKIISLVVYLFLKITGCSKIGSTCSEKGSRNSWVKMKINYISKGNQI